MSRDAVLGAAIPASSAAKPARERASIGLLASLAALAGVGGWAAWQVHDGKLYTSGSDFGYNLGLIGGTLMLLLLLYPVRKHVPFMRDWAPLRYWFRVHMIFGILGPLCVLFHSTFRVGSLNATVALSCMVLVASSGIIGRFIYRKIHHGLYGSRATLTELQQTLAQQLAELEPLLHPIPPIRQAVEHFAAVAARHPVSWGARVAHFLALGWQRRATQRRIRRAVARFGVTPGVDRAPSASRAELVQLLRTIAVTLSAMQRAAQFSTYERLFALWHVLHVPFVYLFVISAVIHVVAVHMY